MNESDNNVLVESEAGVRTITLQRPGLFQVSGEYR